MLCDCGDVVFSAIHGDWRSYFRASGVREEKEASASQKSIFADVQS